MQSSFRKFAHPITLTLKQHLDKVRISALDIHKLQTNTTFSVNELEKIGENSGIRKESTISEEKFGKFLEANYQILDKEFQKRLWTLFEPSMQGQISGQEFGLAFSILSKGSQADKLRFIFQIFDLNGDGKISPKEMQVITSTLWKNAICQELFDFAIEEKELDGVEVFVERFFRLADTNQDGFISREEFLQVGAKFLKSEATHKLNILQAQVGGHSNTFFSLDNDTKVMKAVGKGEAWFYSEFLAQRGGLPSFPFVPQFFGMQKRENDDRQFIVIENLTKGLKCPCVADIKMGTSSVGEDASPEKAKMMSEKDKTTTTHSLGFRVTGLKVWDTQQNTFVRYNKSWGKSLTKDNMTESLSKFFFNGATLLLPVVARFLEQLREFSLWMNAQQLARFYSSSILFVYDGADPTVASCRIRMIDFAHVSPITDQGRDEGYAFGLANLLEYFERLCKNG